MGSGATFRSPTQRAGFAGVEPLIEVASESPIKRELVGEFGRIDFRTLRDVGVYDGYTIDNGQQDSIVLRVRGFVESIHHFRWLRFRQEFATPAKPLIPRKVT